jgi:hypothetical protein
MKTLALISALFAFALGSALGDPTAAALAVRIEKDGDSVDLKFRHDKPEPAAAIVWSSDDLIEWTPADTLVDGIRDQTFHTPIEENAGEVTIGVPLAGYDDLDFGPYPGQAGKFFKVEIVDPDNPAPFGDPDGEPGGGPIVTPVFGGPNVVYCLQDGKSLEGQNLAESETDPWPFPEIEPGSPGVCDYSKYFRIEAWARTFNFPANWGGPVTTEKVVQWITVSDHYGPNPSVKYVPKLISKSTQGSIPGHLLTITIFEGDVNAELTDPFGGPSAQSWLDWQFTAVDMTTAEALRQAQCGAQ